MSDTLRPLDLVSQVSLRSVPEGVKAAGEALWGQYGRATRGILFYGSCLRAGSDEDGLVDCYVLVENYGSAFQSKWLAVANWLLPPNVFYMNVPFSNRVIRVKYAVLSLHDFEKSVTPKWFHSYFWARFAQPVVLLMSANPGVKQRIFEGLVQAAATFLKQSLPQMPQSFTASMLWQRGLALTFGAELRAETKGRIPSLWAHDKDYYEEITNSLMRTYFSSVKIFKGNEETLYRVDSSRWGRFSNRLGWFMRRIQGKFLSVLRLIKAGFTFQGGADYIIWKIERHSGVKIELTPAQRRHPIITGIATFWRLYRQGAFR